MADLRISELAALAGANLAAGDLLPIADVSASETKKITVTDLVGRATTLIADATIPSAKILFGANTIPGSSLTSSSVTATQLADDSVSAAKLADESSVDLVTTLPASGAFVGQIALDTDDSKIYCWNGSTWVTIKAAGSVNTVVGGTTGVVNVSVTASGDQVTINTTLDNTTQAAQFLAGPTAAAGTVGYRTIAGADLPTATTTTKGAVVVNGNGLTLSGDTIAINNSVTAQTSNFHVVQYDSKGLVTSGRLLTSSDVPLATASTVGVTKPGTGLNVTGAGTVNHTNAVAAGSGTKVSFDTEGHVTGTAALVESDIPDLPATKITTGTLDIGRIGTNAVIGSKLANFSVSKIGSTTPTAEHIGQFFFNPISRELFLWDGNVYQPVGISAGEIVFAGTYNAATNLLTSVTAEGATAGFTNNAVLPAASAVNNRHYVVVDNTGTGVSPAPAVALQPPDLLLSNGTSYRLIDVSQTVTAQTASTIVFTATGNITANDVQSAIVEVDSEKLAKAGDTLTGQLLISNTGSLVFEGATDNAFETTLGVVDPTADRTINLPNVSGTVVTTGDTGSVTSTMIADGTILNADVNASAAIAGTKISPDFGSQTVATTGAAAIGPGTSTPTRTLQLSDTTGQPAIKLTNNASGHLTTDGADLTFTGTNLFITNREAGAIVAEANGSERLRITSAGLVGIGTSSPQVSLQVGGGAGSGSEATNKGTVQISAAPTGFSDDGGLEFKTNNFGSGYGWRIAGTVNGSTNPLLIGVRDNSATWSTRVAITAPGNVGIGTTSPAAILHVVSADNATTGLISGATNAIRIVGNNTGVGGGAIEGVNAAASAFAPLLVGGSDLRLAISGTERVRVDSFGRLLVGTSANTITRNYLNADIGGPALQIQGITQATSALSAFSWSSTLNAPAALVLNKSISGTVGTRGALTVADTDIGNITFNGDDGTNFIPAASILAEVDGTPGTNDMPGRLVFSTTADGASSPTERLRITSAGLVGIGTSSPSAGLTVALGNSSIPAAGATGAAALFSNSVALNTYGLILGAATTGAGYIQAQRADGTATTYDLHLQPNGGRVGIGTTSPGRPLEVNGIIRTTVTGTTSDAAQAFEINNSNAGADPRVLIFSGTNNGSAIIRNASTTAGGIQFQIQGGEVARIDSSGRLLVGTSSDFKSTLFQVRGSATIGYAANDAFSEALFFTKTRATSPGTQTVVQSGDSLGLAIFQGSDGSAYRTAAQIEAVVDGTPGTNDMPGRLVFYITADGASSPTERLRITNDGVQCYNQPAPTSKSAAATLTVAELKTGIIQYTGVAATLTLPTGTLTEGGFAGIYTNMTFEWSVINTGSGTCTIGAGTDHTIVGGATVAAGASGRFASRRTAANTFVSYRLS